MSAPDVSASDRPLPRRPLPERTRQAVGRAAVDVAQGAVALLLAVLVTAHTLVTARIAHLPPGPDGGEAVPHHDWHAGLLALAGVPALGALLAAAGLAIALRRLRRGARAGRTARALPLAGILLALAGLVLATWTRAQVGTF
jgi:hypothetical protein